jgi:hypothetical protein
MQRCFLRFFLVLPVILFSACSTIVSSNNQSLTIKALHENNEVVGTTCKLQNSKGEWTTVTPQSVNVRKSFGDMSINCRKDKLMGTKVVASSAEGSTFGNILIGGGIGALVDAGTGNGYSYPDAITVDMMGNVAP